MPNKSQKKKRKNRVDKKTTISLITVGFLIIGFILTIFLKITFSSQAPFIDERKIMLTLPSEIQKILGVKTSSLSKTTSSLRIPILLYHYVEVITDKNDTIRQSLNISPFIFEEQIKTLKEAGYDFLTASDLGRIIVGKEKPPKKAILLTFDDGYRTFYTDTYPILKKYQVKATQYVVVNFLNRLNYLSLNQVKEIADEGLVEIGAHTMDHTFLKDIDLKTAQYQIYESKNKLEALLNKKITSFAYPYGAFDLSVLNLVKVAGFTTAFSTVPGNEVNASNRFFLYRLRPGNKTGEELLNYINQDKF